MKLDDALRTKLIDGIIAALDKEYIYPDVVPKIEKRLRAQLTAKVYDGARSPEKLAKLLTEDLQEVSKDRHLGVGYSVEPLPTDRTIDAAMPAEDRAQMRKHAAQFNAFLVKVERLAGNIGYLRVDGFPSPMVAAGPVTAAMAFVADTDELIVDLRHCGGGDPAGVLLLISYLFDETIHANDIYTRADDSTRQFWTAPVAGRAYADKPVYVLTSARTFSAGEDFAYTLQKHKRAKIVGEVTGGGAHPTILRRLTPNFGIGVPYARSINPITKTNWERVGVKPDLRAPEAKALDVAYLAALRTQRKRISAKQMPHLSDEIDKALDKARKRA